MRYKVSGVLIFWLCALFAIPAAIAEVIENGPVTIYRDQWGTPHVYADREEDAFYGLGYAQAEDRLVDMLRTYLAVRGELASQFGVEFVDEDVTMRRYRHLAEARNGFQRLSPQLKKNYKSFIAGVERYMQDHPSQVPEWAPELEPALPIATMRALLWQRTIFDALVYWKAAGSPEGECAVRKTADDAASPYPKASGSNVWVLMPWRTADGVVIHLGDPHGGFGAWEFRIDAGALKVASSSFPGFALPFIGHTRDLAWGFTLGGPDVSDCYEVVVDPDNPRRFRYNGEWQVMHVKETVIKIKGAPSTTFELEYTRHNGVLSPIVRRDGDRAYVVSIPMMDEAGMLDEQLYKMALARNMQEFRAAIEPGLFPINMMAGSSDGNAIYVRAGRVPIRPSGYDWSRPVPGNTSATAWRGIHPFKDLIRVEDPSTGYMLNTNIAPDMITATGAPSAKDFPKYLFNDRPGRTNSRGRRATEILSSTFAATAEDAVDLALDQYWVNTSAWQDALHAALNAEPALIRSKSRDFRRVAQRILEFDGVASKDSIAALNYYFWRTSLTSAAQLNSQAISLHEKIVGGEGADSLDQRQKQLLISALDRAVDRMQSTYGSVDIRYGDVFRAGRGGVSWPMGGGGFANGATPQEGDIVYDRMSTLRGMTFTPPDQEGLRWVDGGQYHTTVTIFTDPIQSFSALPLGQSGDPTSPYYSNQAQLISARRLKPTYFYKKELLEHLSSEIVLETPRTKHANGEQSTVHDD